MPSAISKLRARLAAFESAANDIRQALMLQQDAHNRLIQTLSTGVHSRVVGAVHGVAKRANVVIVQTAQNVKGPRSRHYLAYGPV